MSWGRFFCNIKKENGGDEPLNAPFAQLFIHPRTRARSGKQHL